MAISPLNDRARQRVDEIVLRARGDRHQADRLLRAQIETDAQFLRDLVAPFLDGIIAHALTSAMPQPVRTPGSKPSLSPSALDDLIRGMRLNIEGSGPTPAPSQGDPGAHADTIRALAAAQARRRQEDR